MTDPVYKLTRKLEAAARLAGGMVNAETLAHTTLAEVVDMLHRNGIELRVTLSETLRNRLAEGV